MKLKGIVFSSFLLIKKMFLIIIKGMKTKFKKIGKFRIYTGHDNRQKLVTIVYLDYIPVTSFNIHDINERKLAAIELVERCNCGNIIAGKICGFHRNSVFKYLRIKRLLGLEALFEDDRGPKSPFKYVGKVRSHIKKLLRKYPGWSAQKIADQAQKDLKISISRSSVANIKNEKEDTLREKNKPSKAELVKIAQAVEETERQKFEGQQMLFDFKWDRDLKEKSKELAKKAPPLAKNSSDQQLLERLQAGERFNFAGGLIHNLFFNEIGFHDIVSGFPLTPSATYQSVDILATLFHSVNLGIPSIEALKIVNASEFGILLGKNRAPEKETVRDHLSEMAKKNLSNDLIDRLALTLLNRNFIDPQVFFIDGHFLPYFGLNVIAKGYHTVRRLAMRGNELYVISDLQGRPLFFITESNEIDFRPIILRSAQKLLEYGISRPMLVFDRGGYGVHFFKEMHEIADFVTWSKHVSDKVLSSIPDESFTIGVLFKDKKYLVAEKIRKVTESPETAKKDGRLEPTSIELRMVILKNVENGKRIAIFTNNREKPLEDIAFYMLNRWGDSENAFKEMMARFNLNYHPGYDIKELEKQPLVENPDIPLIKKAVRTLNKEITELENEILIIEAKEIKKKDKRRQKKLATLKNSILEKKEDIVKFEEKLSQLPDKISIVELLKGKTMNRCDLEKKRLYDLMQFIAYNSRERLVELFSECYDDKRDIKPVLDMITNRAGSVKVFGKTLIVILDWIENKKHRDAAMKLCSLLNKADIKYMGNLELKLSFYISKRPSDISDLNYD